MPAESRPRYANFPERGLKVLIGPNINAQASKSLTRLSIGTYEMSVQQQERGMQSVAAVRSALQTLAKADGLQIEERPQREFVGCVTASNASVRWTVWVTTPFEPGQAAHLIWVKYAELSGEKKIGIAFRLNTTHSVNDIANALRAAQRNAVVLADGEPYVLQGNPPPRFQKKASGEAQPVSGAAGATQGS
ncbi:MAG: hypothetical protein RMM29_06580 [Planctomycetota bacterium]|nr:hypothetical protein [Planctomycetota bacterium]MCX8040533.1 hypothetical protein [Planctomycetota bacterium]MDW8373294.1 hypothetical protein [Planctomycetota bacterium]